MEYRAWGGATRLFRCDAPEVLVSGPAGTGKSRACLEKLLAMVASTPGARGLIVRKTRVALTESALVTLETQVLPTDMAARAMTVRRDHRRSYRVGAGELVVGGLDRPTRIMSTEYDVAYVQEAIELTEEDWEMLTTRLRNGRTRIQQLLADTNPAGPGHWLKRRVDRGAVAMIESRHEDNPRLWDGREWTPDGLRYLARLDGLTGARRDRLRFGRWVQAEHVVYGDWDRARHVVAAAPAWWAPVQTLWSIDFGYTHAMVWQEWQVDGDGRMLLVAELARTGWLPSELGAFLAPRPRPAAVVCDHDAAGRAELEKALGQRTIAAFKAVQAGILAVQKRLRPAGDGLSRLLVLSSALQGRDADMERARLPQGVIEEVDDYEWKTGSEEPEKANDHSMDAARYAVAWVDRLGRRKLGVAGGTE